MASFSLVIPILLLEALLLAERGASSRMRGIFPGSRSILVSVKIGIPHNSPTAQQSFQFPNIIPLLYGNSIVNYKHTEDGQYEIFHTAASRTFIQPMRARKSFRTITGFVIKQSTLGAYPVPMENSIIVIRLIKYASVTRVFLWLVAHGVYSQSQIIKQRLFMRSLASEYVDNIRRSLGVDGCPPIITVSGLCNNWKNTKSGSTLQELYVPQPFKRPDSATFADMKPNVRAVSNYVMTQTSKKIAPGNVNFLFVIFGQFLDHEIVLTPSERIDPHSSVPILDSKTQEFMSFTRAAILRYNYEKCCSPGYSISKRVWDGIPFNRLTSFIDGSAVYGSSHLRVNTLRKFKHGLLISQHVDNEELMPFNNPQQVHFTVHNEPSDFDRFLFASGDVRANENAFLAAVHTLFVREHNRICNLLYRHLRGKKKFRRYLRDGWMFATARQILTAEMQSIVFNEWVPILLGEELTKWNAYDENLDARISLLHSSFAFRWGHSGIVEQFNLRDRKGDVHTKRLRDLFFNTNSFLSFGVDNLILGSASTSAMDIDEQIIDSLRDSLFVPPQSQKLDLASLNLQRNRDLGIPFYLEIQKILKTGSGMDNIRDDVKDKLIDVFGKADKIDAFVGCLSEKKKGDSLLGPLCHEINREQFLRLRDGDRYYYENMAWNDAIADMEIVKTIKEHRYTMAHLVFNNTNLDPSKLPPGISLFQTTSLA